MARLSCVNKEKGLKQTAVCAERMISESKEEAASTEHVLQRKLAKEDRPVPVAAPLSVCAGLLSGRPHRYSSHIFGYFNESKCFSC